MQKVIVHDASPDEGGPDHIEMDSLSARDAVEADPERYSIVHHHAVPVNRSVEDRVTILEGRVKALENANKTEPVEQPVEPEPDDEVVE